MGNNSDSKEETGLDVGWMEESFINLTPHVIVLLKKGRGGNYIEVGRLRSHSPGETVRLTRKETKVLNTLQHDVPVIAPPEYNGFEPDPAHWIIPPIGNVEKGLIVSSLLAEYWKKEGFEWLGGYYSPDSGPESVIRYPNDHERKGEIRGVQRLVCWKEPMFNC